MILSSQNYLCSDDGTIFLRTRYIRKIKFALIYVQGTVLSSFFWGYACTQIIAGQVADRVGAEKVLRICTFSWALLTFFTPLLFDLSYATNHPMLFIILIRSATGIGQGRQLILKLSAITMSKIS